MTYVPIRSFWLRLSLSVGVAALLLPLAAACASSTVYIGATSAPATAPVTPVPATQAPLAVKPARPDLPVIDYDPLAARFPADPEPLSTEPLRTGLRPQRRLAVYDAPGGTAKAFLAPTIRGVELVLPVVDLRSGWAAVLLPSANRAIGWLPPTGWTTVALRDQLIVDRSSHRMLWYRDGSLVRTWAVSLGARATPTPLGRTFVLGQSRLEGYVYADTKVFALGAIPDKPDSVPAGLRGAHIGIHTWYHDRELGQNTTDGCIRLTRTGQRRLLAELIAGTPVVIVDALTTPSGSTSASAR